MLWSLAGVDWMANVVAAAGALVDVFPGCRSGNVSVPFLPYPKYPISIRAMHPLAKVNADALIILNLDKATGLVSGRAVEINVNVFGRPGACVVAAV